jgi:uncharacterized membrane protein
MMIIVLALIGCVLGASVGMSNGSLFEDALLGALLGGALGLLVQRFATPKRGPRPQAAFDDRSLAARVGRMEQDIAALQREVLQLRAQAVENASGGAPARAPASITPQPAAAADRPDAPSAPRPAAQAPRPSSYALPPQPAAARSAADTVENAVANAVANAAATTAATTAAVSKPQADQAAAPWVPPPPDFLDRMFQRARDWLLGGNTVVRIGMVVLFFGIAFLLKYAADNSLLPIELRLAGVALGASALLATGWRIGARRGMYGLVLQGGGVGMLYLVVFAATKLYYVLPVAAALPLMMTICALSAFLAVRQDASPLAFMGSAGGFLAPVVLSSGGGSHVMLFSYYALLNAGIFGIAWFKAWRPLNLLGFVFTFTIGTAWGVSAYRPALLASTEPFLILFFLMYVSIALLYAVHREIALKHYVDGTLVFGTPIVAIGLQAGLMHGVGFGLAWSAVALAAFYLAIAGWLRRGQPRLRMLFEAMLALGVIFATLAIPFAFSGPTTSAAWAVEGAAIVWVGVRQRRLPALGFGVLMQLAAGALFAASLSDSGQQAGGLPVLNSAYIATVLIALAGGFTGWWLHGRSQTRTWYAWLREIGLAAAVWGLLWWSLGGIHEILVYAGLNLQAHRMRFDLGAIGVFGMLSAWLAHGVRRGFAWPLAQWPGLAWAPLSALLVASAFLLGEAPLAGLGWLVWPLLISLGYLLFWHQQRNVDERVLAPLHTLMFWTLCGLLALQGYWSMRAYVPQGAWSWSAWAYGFGVLLLLVAGLGARLRWPVLRFTHAYQVWGAAPLAVLLWGWSLASTLSDGSAAPLFWLPLLNPLDVAQLLALLALVVWLRRLKALGVQGPTGGLAYAALATLFLWLNALLLRTFHHWAGIPYVLDDMARSTLVQASVSVFWTACALAMMIWATRRAIRVVWFVGAGLLGLTVVKLFLFDLSHVQGIERIVSFIGIGLMLLLIGYFSPLPPKATKSMEDHP